MKKISLISIALLASLSLAGCGNKSNKSQHSSSSAESAKVESKKSYNNRLHSFAQSFGTKPVAEIQRMPSTYVAERVGNKTIYGWHPEGLPELVRVDDPETNNTDVYVFDKNGQDNMLGKHLYTGRTIFQKQPKYVPMY